MLLRTPQRAVCHTGLLRDAMGFNLRQWRDLLLPTPQRAWCHTGLLREAVSNNQNPNKCVKFCCCPIPPQEFRSKHIVTKEKEAHIDRMHYQQLWKSGLAQWQLRSQRRETARRLDVTKSQMKS